MTTDTRTISVIMPSDNPWLAGPTVQVYRAEAERIATLLAEACEAQRENESIDSSYHYDSYVKPVLENNMPEDDYARKAMQRAVITVLYERQNRFDWRDGANAARRVLESGIVYSTPGFAEAYANHCSENN